MDAYIKQIRDLINKPILKCILLTDRKKWNLLCGSLDAIESSQLAIDSYGRLDKKSINDVGFDFLIVYGLLQALYVQQDSMSNLCKSIDILPKEDEIKTKYPELDKIRNLRNNSIGHPTPSFKEKKRSNTHNPLINGDSIRLYSYTETGGFSNASYSISDCIDKQKQKMGEIAQQVIEKMQAMEQSHKDKYMQKKLSKLFPNNPQDYINKIFEAIHQIETGNNDRNGLALWYTEDLLKSVNEFKDEFHKRGLQEAYKCVFLGVEYTKYPLEKLVEYFSANNSVLNSQDARISADSVEKNLLDLINNAQSMDEEYLKTD